MTSPFELSGLTGDVLDVDQNAFHAVAEAECAIDLLEGIRGQQGYREFRRPRRGIGAMKRQSTRPASIIAL